MGKAKNLVYNNPQKAIAIAQDIYDNSSSNEEKISSLMILTNAYSVQYDYEKALKSSFLANDLAEKSNDNLAKIRTLGIIGNLYQMLQMNDKVRIYMGKAETIAKTGKIPDSLVHNINGNIFAVKGNSYKDDLDCSFAIQFFDKAISEFAKSESSSAKKNIILVSIQKANCLLEKNDITKAAEYYQKAYSQAVNLELSEYETMAILGLSKTYHAQKDENQAIAIAIKTYKQAKALENQPLIQESSEILSQIYFEKKEFDLFKKYRSINENASQEITKLHQESISKSIDFITERRKMEEQKKENNFTYSILVLIISIVLIIVFFIIRIRFQYQKNQTFFRI